MTGSPHSGATDPVPTTERRGLRVLMVTDFYWPLLGGVEQHVRTLAHELVRIGHHVTVVTLAVADRPDREADAGVDVIRIRSGTQRVPALFDQERPWAPPVVDPLARRGLATVVREVRPDVVHGHDWLGRSLPRLEMPFVSSLHYYTLTCAKKDLLRGGAPCDGPGPGRCVRCAADHYGVIKGTGVAAATGVGRRRELRRADHFIAVSDATARGNGVRVTGIATDADAALDAGCSVIPNFLPEPAALVAPDDGVEALLGLLPDGPFIAYVGDFRAVKGFDLLLEAFRRAELDLPLVAVGKRWPSTPTSIPHGVHLHEKWPNAAVRAMFERATIAVAPSLWAEPFGIAAIEAMAGGTPVIAADHGGLADIVDHGETGLLVPPGDVEALTAAVVGLAADPARATHLGERARVAAQRYRAARVVPEIVEVYDHVLRRRRSGAR